MPKQYRRLFEPGKIGTMETKNRLIMAAMGGISGADPDGYATQLTEDYFEARAKGGIGIVVIGSAAVDWPLGNSGTPRLSAHDDSCIPGLKRVAEGIHRHGAKAAMQLQHAGPSHPFGETNLQPVAASALQRPPDHLHLTYWGPRELTIDEIGVIVDQFGRSAARAREAGYDGVELNAGHRYLINSFISPHWNKREDQYGGDLRGRARFLLEIVESIRKQAGADFPCWTKINGEEPTVQGGITPALAAELAVILEDAGVDAITVSTWPPITPSNPPGYVVKLEQPIKAAVKIPVIAMGRIGPDLGEKLLRRNEADFIAVGRAVAADPEYANKIAARKLVEITPCIYCNNCNNNPTPEQKKRLVRTRGCTVNASLTREREYEIKLASKKRKILVVGGGPAGMEAARVAALRGHEVHLVEKDHKLGGKLILAALLRDENIALIKYLANQLTKLGVKVELGKKADARLVAEVKPDVVVIAVGAHAVVPELEGLERPNVITVDDIQGMLDGHLSTPGKPSKLSLRRLVWFAGCSMMRVPGGPWLVPRMMGIRPFGKHVLIVGRQLPGIELAEFLMRKGTKVTLVDTNEGVGFGEPPMPVLRQYLEEKLHKNNVPMVVATQFDKMTDGGLVVTDKEGKSLTLSANTVIFTGEYQANTTLQEELVASGIEAHVIGDCAKPYGMLEAIDAGAKIGREL